MTGSFEHSQKEQLRQLSPRQLQFLTGLVGMGLMHGGCDKDAANFYRDTHEVMTEQSEENKKPEPPKPPRRPNARIGGLAVGNT